MPKTAELVPFNRGEYSRVKQFVTPAAGPYLTYSIASDGNPNLTGASFGIGANDSGHPRTERRPSPVEPSGHCERALVRSPLAFSRKEWFFSPPVDANGPSIVCTSVESVAIGKSADLSKQRKLSRLESPAGNLWSIPLADHARWDPGISLPSVTAAP